MNLDLAALRRLAEAASPGPWTTKADNFDGVHEIKSAAGADITGMKGYDFGGVLEARDAAYIAAASPDVVIALIERAERAGGGR